MQVNDRSERYNDNLNGFVKLYRKILASAVFKEPKLLKVWCWCLIKAYWTPLPNIFHGKEIMLKRGQFITGRFSGSFECGMSPSTFRFQLKKLELFGNISLETDRQKTLVTVTNYGDYQDLPKENGQRLDNDLTTDGQRVDTNEEVKKIRKKEERLPPTKEDVDDYFLEMGIRNESSKFFDYFESNGWRVGRNKMKDWRSAARNWKRRGIEGGMIKPQAIKKTYPCDSCKQRFNTYELYMNHTCPQALPPPKEFTDALNNLAEKMSTEHR